MDAQTLASIGLNLVLMVAGYFLRQKFHEQEALVKLLFKKHDEQTAKMQRLEISLAGEYYSKREMDERFDKIENILAKIDVKIDRFVEKCSERR